MTEKTNTDVSCPTEKTKTLSAIPCNFYGATSSGTKVRTIVTKVKVAT